MFLNHMAYIIIVFIAPLKKHTLQGHHIDKRRRASLIAVYSRCALVYIGDKSRIARRWVSVKPFFVFPA